MLKVPGRSTVVRSAIRAAGASRQPSAALKDFRRIASNYDKLVLTPSLSLRSSHSGSE